MFYSSWIHGNSAHLERPHSPSAIGKSGVYKAFEGSHPQDGDIIALGNYAAVACLRIGWAARFVVFDSGDQDLEKSAEFWVHYAIPIPVSVPKKYKPVSVPKKDTTVKAETVLINYESSNINVLSIAAVHVWDGNKRIFHDDTPKISKDDFNGGIANNEFKSTVSPNLERLWRGSLGPREIFFGINVSILIRAKAAKNDHFDIRGVGVEFQIEDK